MDHERQYKFIFILHRVKDSSSNMVESLSVPYVPSLYCVPLKPEGQSSKLLCSVGWKNKQKWSPPWTSYSACRPDVCSSLPSSSRVLHGCGEGPSTTDYRWMVLRETAATLTLPDMKICDSQVFFSVGSLPSELHAGIEGQAGCELIRFFSC